MKQVVDVIISILMLGIGGVLLFISVETIPYLILPATFISLIGAMILAGMIDNERRYKDAG